MNRVIDRQSWVTVVAAVLVTAIILVVAHADSGPVAGARDDRMLPVSTVAPERVEQFAVTTRFTGVVESRQAASLSFEPEGRVESLSVEEGDRVEEGQSLAKLDTRRLEAALTEIEGEIESTRAGLSLARQEEERQRNLRRDGASTQRDVDRAVAERRRLQGQLNSLEGRRARVQANLEDAVLKAPFDGVIAATRIEQGDLVSAGTPAFRIIQPDNLEARIGIPAPAADDYQAGDTVALMIGGAQVEGRVLERLPEIDPARRTMTLRVALETADSEPVYAGQIAHMRHRTRLDEPGYVLPESALSESRSGLWALLVAEPHEGNHRLRRVTVEWLNSADGRVLVRGPLDPAMRVVSGGGHRVVPGQVVTLVNGDKGASQ